jgi:LuxR family transcriptional regulator, maltose regulon positive regulatory protein
VECALGILDALCEIGRRSCDVPFQIEVLAIRALALGTLGKAAEALAALEQAVGFARPGGFTRVFVDAGPRMQALLLRLAGRGFAAETVGRILAAFPRPDEAEPAAGSRARAANANLIEPLTDRELDVLVMLRERLSNKEIAQQLGLSVMTVKRHTSNIYGKLGVDNRRDAVVKAESLKLLPPS